VAVVVAALKSTAFQVALLPVKTAVQAADLRPMLQQVTLLAPLALDQ
jgi:hypothetical protein